MQMLKKIFNSDDKYHLVLDETESSEAVQAETAPKVVVATAASAQDNGSAAISSDQESGNKKSPKAAAKAEVAQKEVQPTPKKSAAPSYEPPFWVAAMNNTNNNASSNGSGQGAEVTFASDNLMPTITKYRRLPGGSLAKFRAMAKTAKTPRR
ncbi:MAG: hypothetical protein RLZZ04_3867 [Cyanobacteriota bacterium]|jgi:hypothetical protein